MGNKIKVLHVTPDSKFFDGVFRLWRNDENFDNIAVSIVKNKDCRFTYIKDTAELKILWNKRMVKKYLQTEEYDVVFLHSLPAILYNYIRYVPKDKAIIWWGWGYDIYTVQKGLAPLIKIPLYKPLTKVFVRKENKLVRQLLSTIYLFVKNPLLGYRRKHAISRIDYYQPVLSVEYGMMGNHDFFHAKEFYYKPGTRSYDSIQVKPSDGNILLGNSATPTNNHLDVLSVVRVCRQSCQRIIVPLSYGDQQYLKWLEPQIQEPYVQPIYDYLPSEDYYRIIGSCSYAVFGIVRQQAMGNILYALNNGVKVFLYENSIAYKSLKMSGYVVFSIESMTKESLTIPLTYSEIEQNHKAYALDYQRRCNIYTLCVDELQTKFHLVNNKKCL